MGVAAPSRGCVAPTAPVVAGAAAPAGGVGGVASERVSAGVEDSAFCVAVDGCGPIGAVPGETDGSCAVGNPDTGEIPGWVGAGFTPGGREVPTADEGPLGTGDAASAPVRPVGVKVPEVLGAGIDGAGVALAAVALAEGVAVVPVAGAVPVVERAASAALLPEVVAGAAAVAPLETVPVVVPGVGVTLPEVVVPPPVAELPVGELPVAELPVGEVPVPRPLEPLVLLAPEPEPEPEPEPLWAGAVAIKALVQRAALRIKGFVFMVNVRKVEVSACLPRRQMVGAVAHDRPTQKTFVPAPESASVARCFRA